MGVACARRKDIGMQQELPCKHYGYVVVPRIHRPSHIYSMQMPLMPALVCHHNLDIVLHALDLYVCVHSPQDLDLIIWYCTIS